MRGFRRSKKEESERLLWKLTLQHARKLDEDEKRRAEEKRKTEEEEETKRLEWLQEQVEASTGEVGKRRPQIGKEGAKKRKYPRTGKEGAAKR